MDKDTILVLDAIKSLEDLGRKLTDWHKEFTRLKLEEHQRKDHYRDVYKVNSAIYEKLDHIERGIEQVVNIGSLLVKYLEKQMIIESKLPPANG